MALTPTIWTSQFDITTVEVGSASAQASQYDFTCVFNMPAQSIESSQLDINYIVDIAGTVQVSQLDTVVVMRGNIFNPKLRAWWFELDAHEVYVLNLGRGKTLIVDLSQEPPRWSWWSNPEAIHWRATIGTNWTQSGSVAFNHGSDVIVGDDSTGILWVLDPHQGYDDPIRPGARADGEKLPFPRSATGQTLTRGRDFVPCYEVYLVTDVGSPGFAGAVAELLYSDDQGRNYISAGVIAAEEGNFQQSFVWRSLGQMGTPGRMFRLEDNGAFAIIQELNIADVN